MKSLLEGLAFQVPYVFYFISEYVHPVIVRSLLEGLAFQVPRVSFHRRENLESTQQLASDVRDVKVLF